MHINITPHMHIKENRIYLVGDTHSGPSKGYGQNRDFVVSNVPHDPNQTKTRRLFGEPTADINICMVQCIYGARIMLGCDTT